MTPEQKFLKALAEWLDIKTCPKNRIQMASREYLDQFREVKEKVDQFTDVSKKVEPEPAWKPEVGKLYKRTLNGVVTEITKLKSDRVLHILQRFDYDPNIENGYHEDYIIDFIKEYEPIAELEGLKVGDSVYGIAYQKYTHPWHITGITGSLILVKKHGESAILTLNKRGFSYEIGSTQLFWRTADRAERFGRGDA